MMLEGLLVILHNDVRQFYYVSLIGGIATGALSDVINARAISCVIMMYCAVPTVSHELFDVKLCIFYSCLYIDILVMCQLEFQ